MLLNSDSMIFYDDVVKAGEARGIKKGEVRGEKNILKKIVDMIEDGVLTKEDVCKKYGISKSKLESVMPLT